MKNPEPRYFKRKWKSPDGSMKSRWAVRWMINESITGLRKEKQKGGFMSKEHARTWFRKTIMTAMEAGYETHEEAQEAEEERLRIMQLRQITVKEWFDQYVEERRIAWSNNTMRRNSGFFKRAAKVLKNDKRLIDVTISNIRDFIEEDIAGGKRPSKDTMYVRHNLLRTCFAAAVKAHILESNPCDSIKPPKPSKGRLRFLNREECMQLLKACEEVKPQNATQFSPMTLKAFIATALFTGCRLSEVFHLEWIDLDRESGTCRIEPKAQYGFRTKSGKDRTVGVNPDLFDVLDEYQKDRLNRLSEAEDRLRKLELWQQLRAEAKAPPPDLVPVEMQKYETHPSMQKLMANVR